MAQQRNVATQTQLETVNLGLSTLSGNLAAHANADLSDAHGLNLIFGPTNDGQGNNLSVYADSHNDLVGTFQISLTINGNRVFVPAQVTALAGKPLNTGIDPTVFLSSVAGSGESTWVTEFDDTFSTLLDTMLETYLLPHTLTGYWEAHGGTPLTNPELTHFGPPGSGSGAGWFDSAQHRVARATIKLNVDGLQLAIPCETRLGGPPQTPIIAMIPNSISGSTSSGNVVLNATFVPTILGGTLPITFSWEYFNSQTGLYVAMTPGSPGPLYNVPEVGNPTHASLQAQQQSTATGAIFFGQASSPGGGRSDYCKFRLTATNSSGSTHQDAMGNDLLFFVNLQDNGGGCWFCTESHRLKPMSADDWKLMGKVQQEVYRQDKRALASYIKHGDKLLERMLAGGYNPSQFVDFTTTVLCLAKSNMVEAARHYLRFAATAVATYWPDTPSSGLQRYTTILGTPTSLPCCATPRALQE